MNVVKVVFKLFKVFIFQRKKSAIHSDYPSMLVKKNKICPFLKSLKLYNNVVRAFFSKRDEKLLMPKSMIWSSDIP